MFNVIVLAAGYATRLYPLTENFPKPLLEVAQKPMMNHLLDRLLPISDQIGNVTCVTNNKFVHHFEDWNEKQNLPFSIHILNDGSRTNEDRLGAIRDIHLALNSFEEKGDVMVIAGDNIFDFNLKSFYLKALSYPESVTLACTDVKDRELAKHYGILQLGKDGEVIQFSEKPSEPLSTLASTGIYYFPETTLDLFDRYLKEKGLNPDAPGFYISWLLDKASVFGQPLKGVWYDIGDLKSLREANEIFEGLKGE